MQQLRQRVHVEKVAASPYARGQVRQEPEVRLSVVREAVQAQGRAQPAHGLGALARRLLSGPAEAVQAQLLPEMGKRKSTGSLLVERLTLTCSFTMKRSYFIFVNIHYYIIFLLF